MSANRIKPTELDSILGASLADGDWFVVWDTSTGTMYKIAKSEMASAFGGGGGNMSTSTYDPAGIAEQLVGLVAAQTLTNKTIDADSNTISNIGDEELKAGINATKIGNGDVANDEFSHLNGVTSAIQTQLDNKQPLDAQLTSLAALVPGTEGRMIESDGLGGFQMVTASDAVNDAGAVMNSDTSTAAMSFVVDEDNMASNSATKVPTQQSVKAYVDTGLSTKQNTITDSDDITEGAANLFMTTSERSKLSGIEAGAEANVGIDGVLSKSQALTTDRTIDVEDNELTITDTSNGDFIRLKTLSSQPCIAIGSGATPTNGRALLIQGWDTTNTNYALYVRNSMDNVFTVRNDGVLSASKYGSGNIVTGSETYFLATQSDGLVVEVDVNDLQAALAEGAFVDGDKTKLDGIETGATADQTGAEIKALYEAEANTNAFTDAEQSKLSGIESGADVTDETNVVSALSGATLSDAGAPQATDKVLVQDASDSDNLKYVDFSDFSSGTTVDVVSNVAQDRILGRVTAGSGDSEELTASQVRTLINVEDGAEVNAVDSVNTQTGAVVLDADDISETATNKWLTDDSVTQARLDDMYKAVVTLTGTSASVNWEAGQYFRHSLTGSTTLSDSNLTAGKTIELRIVGNGETLTLPSYWDIVGGGTYDASKVNVLTVTCYVDTGSSEVVEVSIVNR